MADGGRHFNNGTPEQASMMATIILRGIKARWNECRRAVELRMTAAAKAKLTGAWRAVQVIGLGSVIALWVVPRIMQQGEQKDTFIQQQFVDKVDKNTQAITTQTEVTRQQIDNGNRVIASLDELCESHKDLCRETTQQGQRIERLMGKLWEEHQESLAK